MIACGYVYVAATYVGNALPNCKLTVEDGSFYEVIPSRYDLCRYCAISMTNNRTLYFVQRLLMAVLGFICLHALKYFEYIL